MGLIFLDAYEPYALQVLVIFLNADGITLHLYQNNYTPVDGSVLSNFTEATFSGYADIAMTLTMVGEVSGKALCQDSTARTFTHSPGGTTNTIYGYYVYDPAQSTVAWAERFPAPIVMASAGDSISILAQLTLDSANH